MKRRAHPGDETTSGPFLVAPCFTGIGDLPCKDRHGIVHRAPTSATDKPWLQRVRQPSIMYCPCKSCVRLLRYAMLSFEFLCTFCKATRLHASGILFGIQLGSLPATNKIRQAGACFDIATSVRGFHVRDFAFFLRPATGHRSTYT